MHAVISGSRRARLMLALATTVLLTAVFGVAGAGSSSAAPSPPTITKAPFGTANGQAVDIYTLTNSNRMEVKILTYGGILQSIRVPDRRNRFANVSLGFNNIGDYVAKSPFFGAIIGRYANRIAGGTFTLNNTTYHLPLNDNGVNSLHGGTVGFDKHVWAATPSSDRSSASLRLDLTSPNGDQGYPGTLAVTVTYTLTNTNDIRMHYQAHLLNDTNLSTVINLTNHAYFNLAGEGTGDILGHRLQINAKTFTPVDANLIPTGAIDPVAGTSLDFTRSTAIGAHIRDANPQVVIAKGYDFNWVLNRPNDSSLFLAARAVDPSSGRVLEVLTTEPGIQFYSGNFLDGTLVGTGGHIYRQSDGFTLETQHYPDSPNHPNFPSTVLSPGQQFDSTSIYRFRTNRGDDD